MIRHIHRSSARSRSLVLLGVLIQLGSCGGAPAGPASTGPTASDTPTTSDTPTPSTDPTTPPTQSDSSTSVTTLGLSACTETLDTLFSEGRIEPLERDSGSYTLPATQDQELLEASITALASGDGAAASKAAAGLAYRVCQLTEEGTEIVVWTPEEPGTGRPVFAWRAQGARPLIVAAPHPYFEAHVLDQTRQMFRELDAQALLVSGAHRCSSDDAADCDGTTGVCGKDAAYPVSDPAHSTETLFHIAHTTLVDLHPESLAISVHGMSSDGISVSNGTTADIPADSFHALFVDALRLAYPDGPITSCNAYADTESEIRLCGTTNVQGRQLNGSASPCDQAASSASGRFIHLEQARSIRKDPAALIDALDGLLP